MIISSNYKTQRQEMLMKNLIILFVVTALCTFAFSAEAGDMPVFNLTVKDHKFEPATLELPADTKVELHVKNADKTPEEFESIELNREKVIPGGEESVIYIGPLKPGTYGFFGDFNPDTARGKVIVK
jgi:hypothetical protein